MMHQYKIIGGDGKEYGPASLEEIHGWITEGRLGPSSLVWRDDLASWKPASSYDELAGTLGPARSTAAPPPLPEDDLEPVGLLARLGAYLIDALLLSVLLTILTLPWSQEIREFWKSLESLATVNDIEKVLQVMLKASLLMLAQLTLNMAYFVLMNGKLGATVGKMILGAKIIQLDGSPLTVNRAAIRYFCETLNFLTLGFGYFMIGVREDKRGLHDLLAKTRVVYKR